MNYETLKPMLAAGPPKKWGFPSQGKIAGEIFSIDLQMERMFEHVCEFLKHGPLVATPKIDGIRCMVKKDGFPLTRSLKDIPNGYIRQYFFDNRECIKPCFDGELTVGTNFQMATSGIMSHGNEPDFTYWIFDVPSDLPYKERVDVYTQLEKIGLPHRFKTVPTAMIHSVEDLKMFEEFCLGQGFEGVMIRTHESPYKLGRSTIKQGWLMKLKRFHSAECKVVGFEPLHHNKNTPKQSETGNQVRSTEKAGMVTSDHLLGKFLVKGINNGFEDVEFGLGSGLCVQQRECFWENRAKLIGKVIEYKYQPHGVLKAPRTPIFLRFRDAHEF